MIANDYLEKGWKVLPIHAGEKRPRGTEWQNREFSALDFIGVPSVGVHLGPSGLVDVDLDCLESVELATEYLPETSTFGRRSNPRSHWVYTGEGFNYRKFIDPVDKACLLELRCGDGKQTVFPGSIHPSGEAIAWTKGDTLAAAPEDLADRAAALAVAVWCKKHEGEEVPDRVLAWVKERTERTAEPARSTEDVFYSGRDPELIESIVAKCPDGNRHDYCLGVAGTMRDAGIAEHAASEMLAEAMADGRLANTKTTREDASNDARNVTRDTYHTDRPITRAGTLIQEFDGKDIVKRTEELTTPKLEEITWINRLEEMAVGGSFEALEDPEIKNELAKMLLVKDSRLPLIWAKLKDGGFQHLRELKESCEFRMREIRKSIDVGEPLAAKHPDAVGMKLPAGYELQNGKLVRGDELVLGGELELLAKCPGTEGVHVRFAFRTPGDPSWRTSVAPYRSLVDPRGVLVLADHGCNMSALESAAIVAYVRDFVGANEKLLDRPIATQTGWHASGSFIWGRKVLNGPKDLRAEFPTDDQIGIKYVEALHAEGSAAKSFDAIREAVETLPTASICIAASLAAAWCPRLKRPTIGVHVGGTGGKGKTRTLKIAGSVWGATGSAQTLASNGTIAGANTTQRALEVAASNRNDLPFFLSDVRPFPGLTEVLHSVLNGDPRARATATGGSLVGEPYRCGAVISEGEINMLQLTTRQGFHRRMLELEPDKESEITWRLGCECSDHFGHLGPAMLKLGEPPTDRFTYWQESIKPQLGHEQSTNGATLLTIAEHVSPLLGADATVWCAHILKTLLANQEDRKEAGDLTQEDRAGDALAEIMVDFAPQIAGTQELTKFFDSNRPWVGYQEGGNAVIRGDILRKALNDRGHHAIRSVLIALVEKKLIESIVTEQKSISGQRVRCYVVKEFK